jgi:tRNA threonylcarbamoyladenosine biosynthesis protein TsaB
MAAVKGINLVNRTPLICVTSLEAIAYPASEANPNKNILAVLDAKRGEVYCQMFDPNMKNLSPPQMLGYEEVVNIIPDGEFIATGNGIPFVMECLQKRNIAFTVHDNNAASEATNIAFIAAIKLASSDYSDTFSPLYIRTPDAKIKAT